MTWFVFEYTLVYLSCSIAESRNCISSAELLISFWRKYFIEDFSVFLHSDNLQRVLMWSSPLTAAAIILRMQRYKARMQYAMLQSSTCRFFSAAIDQLHLTIEIIIGPSTPYPLFLPWFLLWLSSVVCYHQATTPLQARNLIFYAGHLALSIGSILCSPIISPQIRSQPRCITPVLSCSSALRLPFGRVAYYTVRHGAELLRGISLFWILDFGAGRRWLFGQHKMSTYETLCPRWVCVKK